MSDYPAWAVLAVIAVIFGLSLKLCIDCVRYANGVIKRCERIQKQLEDD